ncbi:MAG: hypothetical protein ABWY10_03155, partial [Tardiphaga sp.]
LETGILPAHRDKASGDERRAISNRRETVLRRSAARPSSLFWDGQWNRAKCGSFLNGSAAQQQ